MGGQCIGPRSDHCTKCRDPRILLLNTFSYDNLEADALQAGQCIQCTSTCKEGKCVAEGSNKCTERNEDRAYVPEVLTSKTGEVKNADHGSCHKCSDNCKMGACVGPYSNQCTACKSNRVMLSKDRESHGNQKKLGESADTTFGSCELCYETCKQTKCVGPYAHQCTECTPHAPLLVPYIPEGER